MSEPVTLRLEPGIRKRLDQLAKATERSRAALAAEAVRQFVELNEWQIAAIEDPLSRLLAASLVTLRGQANHATLVLAMETASAQGWRQPLLTYLKLLEKSAAERSATSEQQTYAVRIRLIEEALRKPTTKPPADPIK